MTSVQILVLAVAAVAVAGVLGAFVIAYRRTTGAAPSARVRRKVRVSRETRRADRSRLEQPVVAAAPAEEEEEKPEADAEAAEEEGTEVAEPEPEPAAAMAAVEVAAVEELSPEETGVNRRQFFTRALGITFGSFLGLNGIAYLAFLWPRLSGGFGSDIDVGDITELRAEVFLADGSILPKFVPEARAYIVPFAETDISRSQFEGLPVVVGGLTALFQRCVHLGCRVPWCETSQGFECPCHGSKYNFAGEYEAGPAPRNLDRFALENQEGRLIVKTGTILQTSRAIAKTVRYPQGPSCIALDAGTEA